MVVIIIIVVFISIEYSNGFTSMDSKECFKSFKFYSVLLPILCWETAWVPYTFIN